jgi:hypothetical protein
MLKYVNLLKILQEGSDTIGRGQRDEEAPDVNMQTWR